MVKNCSTCFYDQRGILEEPCVSCLGGTTADETFGKWVAMDFLKNIPDSDIPKAQSWVQMELQLEDKVTNDSEQTKWQIHVVNSLINAPTKGVKYDSDKPRWELVPFRAMKDVVDVLTYGSKKYADDNWKIVPDARKRYVSAAFRHLTDWADGEKKDKETGKSHLAHAICCLLFLLWFEQEDE